MTIQNTYRLNVDIKQKNYINEPVVTSNDQVTFILQITDDGLPFDLSNVTTFTLVSVRPDRKSIMTLGQLTNDEVAFDLGTSELKIPGQISAAIQMYDVNGRISSIPFSYVVLKDLATNYVPSENEKTLIELVLGEGPAILDAAKQATIDANVAAQSVEQVKNDTIAVKDATEQVRVDTLAVQQATEKAKVDTLAVKDATEIIKNETELAKQATEQATTNAIDATNAINLVLPNVINLEYVEVYNPTTQYEKNNIVRHGKNSYIALQPSSGKEPTGTTDSPYWGVLAIGGVDGTGTGTVTSVNGIPPVNGDVTVTIPDPDLSGFATKDELQNVDDALMTHVEATTTSIKGLEDALVIVDNNTAKKLGGYFPLRDANLMTDLSSYAFANDSSNTPPGGDGWGTIANFPGLENNDRAIQLGNNWNDFSRKYYLRRKEGAVYTPWSKIITEESRVWSNVVLQNGWSGNISYRKNAIGQLELILDVKAGTSSVGTIVSQLPEGYRPSKVGYLNLLIPSNGGIINGAIYINYEGKIMVASGSNLGSGNYFVASLIAPLD